MSSLATRCGSCGTVFRVGQEQLKASEGWVRCGRCHEVFNALDGLFDLDHEVPPPVPVAWTPQLGHEDEDTLEALAPAPAPVTVTETDVPLEPVVAEPAVPEAPPRWLDPEAPGPRSLYTPEPEVEAAWARAAAATGEAADPAERREPPAAAPQLRRQAPPLRPQPAATPGWSGLRLAVIGLSMLLLMQLAGLFRAPLQQAVPALDSTLERICKVLFCPSGSSLATTPAGGRGLVLDPAPALQPVEGAASGIRQRLVVHLQNPSASEQALPALELTLNDSLGGVLARRVLTPEELRLRGSLAPAPARLAAGQRLSLERDFDLPDGARPGGFSVQIAPQP